MPSGILVSRPEPGASETARRLRAMGLRPVLAPVSVIEPRRIGVPGGVQAVLVTSANALPSLTPGAAPLFAVGDATARRARAAGFADARSAAGDAAALLALVSASCDPARGALLLAAGAGQGRDLAASLRAAGFRVVRRVAYAARPARALPAEALAALRGGEVAAALVFSPESGRRLVAKLRAARIDVRGIAALAISDAAARALFSLPWARIHVASHPNQDALLGLLT